MRYKVHDVFFQVRTRTRNDLDLVLTDHFGKRNSQLCCAHSAGKRDHHLAIGCEMRLIALGRIDQCRSVEMQVVLFDKL